MKPVRHWPSELGLLGLLALALVPFILTTSCPIDEFLNLSHGLRTLRGQVIYRDFFEFTPPLSHWLPAALFALTGPSLLAARLLQAVLLLFSGWAAYRSMRLLRVSPWLATLPGLLMLMVLHRELPGFSHHWVSMPAALATLWAALEALADGRRRWWLATGLGAGAVLLSIQTDGLMVAGVLAGWLVMVAALGGSTWREAARRAGLIALGAAAPVGAVLAYLASQGALAAMVFHLWTWPLQYYKQSGAMNDVKLFTDLAAYLAPNTRQWVSLPFYYVRFYHYVLLDTLAALVAAGAVAWGLGQIAARSRGRRLDGENAGLGLLALLCVGALAALVRGKADILHVIYYSYPALMLATVLAHRLASAGGAPELALVRRLPTLMLLGLLLSGTLLQAQTMRQSPEHWLRFASPDRVAEIELFRFLKANTGPDDRIAGLPEAAIYYFYGPRPASRFTLVQPPADRYNSPEDYRTFWQEVQAQRPKFVLVAPLWEGPGALASTVPDRIPGYKLLPKVFETPLQDWMMPTYVYERID